MRLSISQSSPALEELLDPGAELDTIGSGFGFTEGPAWNPAEQALRFSDIPESTRYRWSRDRGVEVELRPTHNANGMVYEPDGGLLVCEHATSALVRYRPDGQREVVAARYQGMELNSPNDVITRSDGSIYFSDPTYGRTGRSAGAGRPPSPLGFQGVFRIAPGGGEPELVVRPEEFTQPNGLCFSPDESVLYVDDPSGIKRFDVGADGSLGAARVLIDMRVPDGEARPGTPDGMRCDERGNVWSTGPGGLWVVTPDGELLGVIETPEVCANLVWGGEDLHTLFLTMSTSVRALRTRVGPAPLPYH